MFGTKNMSFADQMKLRNLVLDCKESANDAGPESKNEWSGEYVLWHDDSNRRKPLMAIFMDHSTQTSSYGMWWTRAKNGTLHYDEELDVLMRG